MAGLPPEAAKAASDSKGAASQVASTLPAAVAGGLADAAKMAFTDALGIAVLVAAGVALTGSVLIARSMSARHLPDGESAESSSEAAVSDLAKAETMR